MPQTKRGTEHKYRCPPGSTSLVSPNEWEGTSSTTSSKSLHLLPTREAHSAHLSKEEWKICLFLDHDRTFFLPSPSLPQTPAMPERRCCYTLACTQLSEVPRLHVAHGNATRTQDHARAQQKFSGLQRWNHGKGRSLPPTGGAHVLVWTPP